ncbi:hypothetical protein D3C85_1823090 [compost metagenome]
MTLRSRASATPVTTSNASGSTINISGGRFSPSSCVSNDQIIDGNELKVTDDAHPTSPLALS